MMDMFVPLILAAALLLVGPILGTIAFFNVRTLRREINELKDAIGTASPAPPVTRTPPAPAARAETDSAGDTAVSEPVIPEKPVQPAAGDEAEETEERLEPAARDRFSETYEGQKVREEPAKRPSGALLEETVGAKWAVWVGGIALAFGAIFLVRYSIEQGLLGPGARIIAGLVFALALCAAGEWTRRRGAAFSVGGFENANVPAILTAVGTLGGFATIYAAYQLYGFLGPASAFVLLGVIAVATMAAALLHGPLLAALGIVASFLVPFLVSSQEPNAGGLAAYAFAVSTAAFGVGRLRLWRWLAVIASLGLVFFALVLFLVAAPGERPVLGLYILASWVAVFHVFVASLYERVPERLQPNDRMAVGLLSLLLLLGWAFVAVETDAATVIGLVLMVLVPFASAFYYAAVRLVVPVSVLLVFLGYGAWELSVETWQPLARGFDPMDGISPTMLPGYQQKALSLFGLLGLGLAVLAGLIGLLGALRSAPRVPLAFGGAFLPVLILAMSYVRTDFLDISARSGVIALVLCAGFFAVAQWLDRRAEEDDEQGSGVVATYLIAALFALTLGLCMLLERAALTVALALIAPATAIVYSRRPLPALRPLALVPAALYAARLIWDPAIVGSDLGTMPVFNWLLFGYGIPAMGFAATAWLLSLHGRDRWLEAAEGAAVASATLAIAVIGLHAIEPGEVFSPIDTLPEAAFLVLVGGGVALGLLRLRATGASTTLRGAADLLGYAGMAGAILGLIGAFNPLWTGEPIGGGVFVNKLLFAYLLTGLLYGAVGYLSATQRPEYSRAAYAVGGILVFAWVSLTIRHWFHPVSLDTGVTTDPELYAYSAAWLVIGITLLASGMVSGVPALRLLSGVVIVAVVVKVFIIDMSNLTGFLRALSFIGLGAVLVAIGLVYQRLLRRQT